MVLGFINLLFLFTSIQALRPKGPEVIMQGRLNDDITEQLAEAAKNIPNLERVQEREIVFAEIPSEYKIGVIADPQYGFINNEDWTVESKRHRAALHTLSSDPSVFLIINVGDLIQQYPGFPNPAYRTAQLRSVLDDLKYSKLQKPLFVIPGNHDVGDVPTASSIVEWERVFGKSYYAIILGHVMLVCLNSTVCGLGNVGSKFETEQLDWFTNLLEKHSKRGVMTVLIFSHHPFFVKSFDEPDELGVDYLESLGRNVDISKRHMLKVMRQKYEKVLDKYGVQRSFHGHLHWNSEEVLPAGGDSRVHEFHQTTVSAIGRPLKNDKPGFGLITIKSDAFSGYQFVDVNESETSS